MSLGQAVLGYILPHNREAMEYAIERLSPEHFSKEGEAHRILWTLLTRYAERYNDVFSGAYLIDTLKRIAKADEKRTLLYTETYNVLCAAEVQAHSFQYAVDGLRDEYDKWQTGNVITDAFTVLETGKEIDGTLVEGHSAARAFLFDRLAEIDEQSRVEEAPEGDMREDVDRLWEQYLARENQTVPPGVQFGIEALDECTGGMQPGELVIAAAYTNEGKSQFLSQMAWHAAVKQGKSVFFATSETVRDQTMRRILCRHSREPQFGLPNGLDNSKVKKGTLSKDERDVFQAVLTDFSTNTNYATPYISQIPRNANLNFIETRAVRVNQKTPIDLILMDYLQLLKPTHRRNNEREEFNEILRDTKVFATGFDKGRGIPFVTPWQMSRDAYKAALAVNGYSMASLSDTSEAEKSADLVVTLLRPSPDAFEAVMQVPKNRDGPVLSPSPVFLDYRCSYIGDSSTGAGIASNALADNDFALAELLT